MTMKPSIYSSLYDAVACGDHDTIREILTNYSTDNKSVNFSKADSSQLLERAITGQMPETLALLLSYGFSVAELNYTVRLMPATLGHTEMAKLLH